MTFRIYMMPLGVSGPPSFVIVGHKGARTRALAGGVPPDRVVLGVRGSGVRVWEDVAPADAACQTLPFHLKQES